MTIFGSYVDKAMFLHRRAAHRWAAYNALIPAGVPDDLLDSLRADAQQAEAELFEHLQSLRSQAQGVLRAVNGETEKVN